MRFQCRAGREPRLRPWEHGFYNAGHLRSNFLYGTKSRMTDPLALRVVRRFLAGSVLAPNSVKAKPKKDKAKIPGKGTFFVEPLDDDDTFPPAIDSFEIVDGWVFYHGTNGSEGVVGGPQRKLDQWADEVKKFREMRKEYGHAKAKPWTVADGGEANVNAAIEAAEHMFRLGGVRAEIRVWIEGGGKPSGSASGGVLNLTNVHLGGSGSDYIGGTSLSIPAQVGAHEAAHIVFAHGAGKAKGLMELLKKRGAEGQDALSMYHAVAGHFEGVMEAAALYVLAPNKLKVAAPDVYEATAHWLG